MENKKSVFLIPSRVQTTHQGYLLQTCIESIQRYHPESDIVVINDCTTESFIPELRGIQRDYVEKEYHNCGELNAYVWACKNYDQYDTFVVIHDSTKLIKRIPLEIEKDRLFRPIWHSNYCVSADTTGEEVETILKRFTLDVREPYEKIQQGGYYGTGGANMIFGAMGIFTKEFARKLSTETNFIEIAKLFHKRILRCFFERFLFCIVYRFQDTSQFRLESLCGCIFSHGNPFKNRTPEDHAANNPYIVKCWQER
jgi:hypothetical protein